MARHHVLEGAARTPSKGASSIACLAFVIFLAIAFWAGALWIGETLVQITGVS